MSFYARRYMFLNEEDNDGVKIGNEKDKDGNEVANTNTEDDEYRMEDEEEETPEENNDNQDGGDEGDEPETPPDEDEYTMNDEEGNEEGDEDEYTLPDDEPEDDDNYTMDDDNTNEPEVGTDDGEEAPAGDGDVDGGAEPDGEDEDNYNMEDDAGEENQEGEDTDDKVDDDADDAAENLGDEIANMEEKIYQDLSDTEKTSRIFELKMNCSNIYNDCVDIIEQLSNVPKTSFNKDVIESVLHDLINLKQYTIEYVTNVFDSKSYSENKVWYNKTKVVMDAVRNVLKELVKQTKKQDIVDDTHITEAALNTKQRNKLKDSDFGLPKERKFPIHDRAHVKSALRFFSDCPENKKPELAKRILSKAKEFGVEISPNNPILKYK